MAEELNTQIMRLLNTGPFTPAQEQTPVEVPVPDAAMQQLLPPIEEPTQLAVPPQEQTGRPTIDIEMKILRNEPLTPEELLQLEGEVTPLLDTGQVAGEFLNTMAGRQTRGLAVAGAAEAGGAALGGLAGQPLLGASIGSVSGALVNQALGFEEPSTATLLFSAISPAAVDISMDVVRPIGRRAAGLTRIGRESRAKINANALEPMALDTFAPGLGIQMNLQASKIARTRQSFRDLEDSAFLAVRSDGSLIDLDPVGAAIGGLPDDTVNLLRGEFARRGLQGRKFDELVIPHLAKRPRGLSKQFLPDPTFTGEQLVDFRQRLGDIKDTLSRTDNSLARTQRIEIDRVQAVLDDVLETNARQLEAAGQTGPAANLRRANRVSQFRIAADEWSDLLGQASGNLQVGRTAVPEYRIGTIDKEVREARRIIGEGRRGTGLDTFVRMIGDQPGGFSTWDDLMRSVRANSPTNNITIFQGGDNLLTRTASGAARVVGINLINEAILHPVSRKLLADQLFFQGHTTVTRRFLSTVVAIGRAYTNLSEPTLEEEQILGLANMIGQRMRAQQQQGLPPQAPGAAAGAITQLLPRASAGATTQLGPESLNIPAGVQPNRAAAPSGVLESELPPFLRAGPFSTPRGSSLGSTGRGR